MKYLKTIIFTLAVALCSMNTIQVKADVQQEKWYGDAVNYFNEIKEGTGTGYYPYRELMDFNETDVVTRGEAAVYICELGELLSGYESINPFTDLNYRDLSKNKKSRLYHGIVELHRLGVYEGVLDSANNRLALPFENITREQAASLLVRAFELEQKEEKQNVVFSDAKDISVYAKEAVAICTSQNIISGYPDGSFRPQNVVTKPELVTMLYNVLTHLPEGYRRKAPLESVYTPEYEAEGVVVTADVTVVNPDEPFDIVITNNSDYYYTYSIQYYQLEKKVDGKWIVGNRFSCDIDDGAFTLAPHTSSQKIVIKLNRCQYEPVTSGEYRIVFSLPQGEYRWSEYILDKNFCAFEFIVP